MLNNQNTLFLFTGPDKDESSSEVSSVSSLTDTSLSEVEEEEEEEEEMAEHINEALQKLKAARDKKIQMSLEKKTQIKKQENGKFMQYSMKCLLRDWYAFEV